MRDLTPAEMEALMRRALVVNFRAQFDVLLGPAGGPESSERVTLEIVMPAGELRHEAGWEVPHGFIEQGTMRDLMIGRAMLRLHLLPEPSYDREKAAVIRVVTGEEAPHARHQCP